VAAVTGSLRFQAAHARSVHEIHARRHEPAAYTRNRAKDRRAVLGCDPKQQRFLRCAEGNHVYKTTCVLLAVGFATWIGQAAAETVPDSTRAAAPPPRLAAPAPS